MVEQAPKLNKTNHDVPPARRIVQETFTWTVSGRKKATDRLAGPWPLVGGLWCHRRTNWTAISINLNLNNLQTQLISTILLLIKASSNGTLHKIHSHPGCWWRKFFWQTVTIRHRKRPKRMRWRSGQRQETTIWRLGGRGVARGPGQEPPQAGHLRPVSSEGLSSPDPELHQGRHQISWTIRNIWRGAASTPIKSRCHRRETNLSDSRRRQTQDPHHYPHLLIEHAAKKHQGGIHEHRSGAIHSKPTAMLQMPKIWPSPDSVQTWEGVREVWSCWTWPWSMQQGSLLHQLQGRSPCILHNLSCMDQCEGKSSTPSNHCTSHWITSQTIINLSLLFTITCHRNLKVPRHRSQRWTKIIEQVEPFRCRKSFWCVRG